MRPVDTAIVYPLVIYVYIMYTFSKWMIQSNKSLRDNDEASLVFAYVGQLLYLN